MASKVRECGSIAEALRWAAAMLENPHPDSQVLATKVTAVRIRELEPAGPSMPTLVGVTGNDG